LRSWSTAARLDNFVIGAARLAKCADWSNAPYITTNELLLSILVFASYTKVDDKGTRSDSLRLVTKIFN